jgi:hypothetical protein
VVGSPQRANPPEVALVHSEQPGRAVPIGEHHVGRVRDSDVVEVAGSAGDDLQGRRVVLGRPLRQFIRLGGHVGGELARGGRIATRAASGGRNAPR